MSNIYVDDGSCAAGQWYTFTLCGSLSQLSVKTVENALLDDSNLVAENVVFDVNNNKISIKTNVSKEKALSYVSSIISSFGCIIEPFALSETNFIVNGMSCVSCARRIESFIGALRGVEKVSVNFTTSTCKILHDKTIITAAELMKVTCEMGYSVNCQSLMSSDDNLSNNAIKSIDVRLMIGKMSCASCASRIEKCVRQVKGVESCNVNNVTGICTLTLQYLHVLKSVEQAINSLGYVVSAFDDSRETEVNNQTRQALEKTQEINEHQSRFIGAAFLAAPLAVVMLLMAVTDVFDHDINIMIIVNIIEIVFTTPLVFYYGSIFFIRAWKSLKHNAFTMDTLVAIGTGCSYAYSVFASVFMIFTKHCMTTYFDTAGMLLAFMLLGRYLEARVKRKTNGALIELMNLVPPVSIIITPQGDMTVPSSFIKKGTLVRVLVGDQIPVDGVVVEGISDVNEQMITGEVLPREVIPGSAVIGGTTNVTAMLLIEAKKVGRDSVLSQILRVVQEAQNSKPEIQHIADTVAAYFVPFVICFSLLVFAVWWLLGVLSLYPRSWLHREESTTIFAFEFFIASVVAACPCALGLATPTAILVGTGVGAKIGILVKSSRTLEIVRKARCIIFDKTGTITYGNLKVVFKKCWGDNLEKLQLAIGTVEQHSSHPVARAVASGILPVTHKSPYEVLSSTTHSGLGIEAVVRHQYTKSQHTVHIGNVAMLRKANVEISEDILDAYNEQCGMSRTVVVGAIDGVARIVIALSDELKPEAFGVVRFLREQGFRVLMITGDNKDVAAHVANAVGIFSEDVFAEAHPMTKASIVQQLQLQGHRVIFVGDGINDSPALAQADVGVALGAGTKIALEAADAVLVRNNLVDIINLRALSIVTVRRIYGNFVWAFGYNIVILPFASGIFYPILFLKLPPVMAGIAMIFSSLCVLLSSLSIKWFAPYSEEVFIKQNKG